MRSSAVALFVACWLTSIRLSLSNLVLLRRAIHRSDDLYRNREAKMNRGFMPPGCWLPLS
jgi:hypothetical protein